MLLSCTFSFPVSSLADLVHLITRSPPLPTLVISFYGYHFLPSSVEAVSALDYPYTTMANEPFEALLFGRQWNLEGHSLTLSCDVHEDVGMLFMLQLGQVSCLVKDEYKRGMCIVPQIKEPTYAHLVCLDSTLQTRMPMTKVEWNLEPGQWIIAQVTDVARQLLSFCIVASELRVADIAA
ncbi:hypothetical protein B0H17DRAFT_1128817 [Mycena rosella]|uniref:Uncharacterized protein n=1 Tax=Mycena rosella TaxID=1033263 RepID=A0AAD7DVL7_MYCRO|nr:hypothetical protein B0H17DRAFT_1128817 [Mycena rosella]